MIRREGVDLTKSIEITEWTDHGVLAVRSDEPPPMTTLRRARKLSNAIAASYHGTFDGWEAALPPPR